MSIAKMCHTKQYGLSIILTPLKNEFPLQGSNPGYEQWYSRDLCVLDLVQENGIKWNEAVTSSLFHNNWMRDYYLPSTLVGTADTKNQHFPQEVMKASESKLFIYQYGKYFV